MENISYENAILRLEEIIKILEEGKAPLEETVVLYDEALKLAQICDSKLKTAKQKITDIDNYLKEFENNE